MNTFVSVVVPTYKRPDLLERCLQALVAQSYDPAWFEIIIADDANERTDSDLKSESTRRIVEAWQERYPVYRVETASRLPPLNDLLGQGRSMTERDTLENTVLEIRVYPTIRYLPVVDSHGPAAARNQGWRAAHGSIIAFTDDDTIPAPDWIERGAAAMKHGYAGVMGKTIVPLTDQPTDYELNAAGLEQAEFITANCFYRKAALEAVGGFDEAFHSAWREDSDLYFSLMKHGFSLGSACDAVVVHPVRPAGWGISIQQQKKNFYNALLYKKHPILYRERLQPRAPYHYYMMMAGLLAAVIGAAAGVWWLAAIGTAVWVYLEGRFCLHRLRKTSHHPRHILEMFVTSVIIPPVAIYWRIRGAVHYRVFFF